MNYQITFKDDALIWEMLLSFKLLRYIPADLRFLLDQFMKVYLLEHAVVDYLIQTAKVSYPEKYIRVRLSGFIKLR